MVLTRTVRWPFSRARRVMIAALAFLAACCALSSCWAASMNWVICAELAEDSSIRIEPWSSTDCGSSEVSRAAVEVSWPSS